MRYRKSFNEYLNNVEKYDSTKYIGTGNPNARVLIISKELDACDSDDQLYRELKNNHSNWAKNAKSNLGYEDVADYNAEESIKSYNPLYPYNGKILKSERSGHAWRKYQMLCDLAGNKTAKRADDKFDFHNSFFLTEMCSAHARKDVPTDKRCIHSRKEMMLDLEFFGEFKVIILSGLGCVGLEKKNGEPTSEIEDIFDVTYKGMKEPVKDQRYWIHTSSDNKRVVIQTRQLKGKISDDYMHEIAKLVKEYTSK